MALNRYMRTILFFDLPTLTAKDRKEYRHFVKNLITVGFYRIQESVFVMMNINPQGAESVIKLVRSFKPSGGNIMALTVTEQQFARMDIILGEMSTDVVSTMDRIIEI